jgi:hypothetical protein
MSAAKHTPGPWSFSRWDQFGDARFYVAQAEGAPYTPNHSDVAVLIAETVSGERVAIQEANARLIAAAPGLLRTLELILGSLEFEQHMHSNADPKRSTIDFPRAIEMARAAIAKATGSAA